MLQKYNNNITFPRLIFDNENYQRWVNAIKEKIIFSPLEFSDAINSAKINVKFSRKHNDLSLGFSIICLKDINEENTLVIISPFVVNEPGNNGVLKVAMVIDEQENYYNINFEHPRALKIMPKQKDIRGRYNNAFNVSQVTWPNSQVSFVKRNAISIYKNYMLMPLLPGCDMQVFFVNWGALSQSNSANLSEKCQIAIAIISALQKFHSNSMVHMDVKLENILIYRKSRFDRFEVNLVDFDDAKLEKEKFSGLLGTPYYISPEIVSNYKKNRDASSAFSMDVYSLGTSLIALFVGKLVFKLRSKVNYIYYDQVLANTEPLDLWDNFWKKKYFTEQDSLMEIQDILGPMVDVLKVMVDINASKRPTLAKVLEVFQNLEISLAGRIFRNNCEYVTSPLPRAENMQILKFPVHGEYTPVKGFNTPKISTFGIHSGYLL